MFPNFVINDFNCDFFFGYEIQGDYLINTRQKMFPQKRFFYLSNVMLIFWHESPQSEKKTLQNYKMCNGRRAQQKNNRRVATIHDDLRESRGVKTGGHFFDLSRTGMIVDRRFKTSPKTDVENAPHVFFHIQIGYSKFPSSLYPIWPRYSHLHSHSRTHYKHIWQFMAWSLCSESGLWARSPLLECCFAFLDFCMSSPNTFWKGDPKFACCTTVEVERKHREKKMRKFEMRKED